MEVIITRQQRQRDERVVTSQLQDVGDTDSVVEFHIDMLPADLANPLLVLDFGIEWWDGTAWVPHVTAQVLGGPGATLTPMAGFEICVPAGRPRPNARVSGKLLRGFVRSSRRVDVGGTLRLEAR